MPRLDPIIALTSSQRGKLTAADVRDPQGVLRVSRSLTLDQLAGAAFFTNARVFMEALDEAPVRATKELGNLERRFVARMLDQLELDTEWIPVPRGGTRQVNEGDVFDLHVLRVVLGLAGLLKKRGGLFSLTQRGRRLLAPERAAELYELLLRTYFGRFNLFYGHGYLMDPYVQRDIVLALWLVRRLAEHPVATSVLAKLVPHDLMTWREESLYPGAFDYALEVLVLEPLERFGLLLGEKPDRLAYRKSMWQITPLFDEALSFALDDAAASGEDAGVGAGSASGSASGRRRNHLRRVDGRRKGEASSGGAGVSAAGEASRRDSSLAVPAPRIVRLTITLNDVLPTIWRRLEVPEDITFERLHVYVNAALGWLDYHLHEFQVGRRRITPDVDWLDEAPSEDEALVALSSVLSSGARRFLYRYDYGDDWEHTVDVEAVGPAEPGVFYPRCTAAERACPPEDCGGAPGYADLLRALADSADPERDALLEWLGEPFDPEAVDIDEIDRVLRVATTGELRPEDWAHLGDD
jgi:hypothetical protein